MTEKREIKIRFMPGCFDNFNGTPEELQELIAHIHQMAADGTLEENSTPVDLEEDEFIELMKKKIRQ